MAGKTDRKIIILINDLELEILFGLLNGRPSAGWKKREENKFPTNKAVIIKYFIYFKFI